jgi:hypothetical protein
MIGQNILGKPYEVFECSTGTFIHSAGHIVELPRMQSSENVFIQYLFQIFDG